MAIWGLVYFTHLETVQETGRRRFIGISKKMEETMAEEDYREMLQICAPALVPGNHPIAVRVRTIAGRIAYGMYSNHVLQIQMNH